MIPPLNSVAMALLTAWSALGLPQAVTVSLKDEIRTEGLPLMVDGNHLGLGDEARILLAWITEHRPPLRLKPRDLRIEDETGNTVEVTGLMGRTLEHLNQWYGLAATAENPITHDQLKAAALSPASVARIQRIFENAIERGVRIGSIWLTPESGGEASIDAELRLVEAKNPSWGIVRQLARVADDPRATLRLYDEKSREVAALDRHQLLKLALDRFRLHAPGAAEEVRRAVLTVAENSAPTYSHEPSEQFAIIASTEWRGRYVGRWHTHAPHWNSGRWTSGDGPSFEDMQNAIAAGQYLTLAFQPDGFDLYDAAAMAETGRLDLTLMKVIRYRAESWKKRFVKLRPR